MDATKLYRLSDYIINMDNVAYVRNVGEKIIVTFCATTADGTPLQRSFNKQDAEIFWESLDGEANQVN